MTAARMGRGRSHPLRHDWEQVKDDVMRRALHAKFIQHPALRQMLLDTGDADLVEHTRNGIWDAGTGKNMLGHLLVELRTSIRNDEQQTASIESKNSPIKSLG